MHTYLISNKHNNLGEIELRIDFKCVLHTSWFGTLLTIYKQVEGSGKRELNENT